MADPFAVLANSQVSVPGLIGVYEQSQDRRINQMLMQRKIAADDRAQELDIQKRGVMARLYQPKGGGQASGGAAPESNPPAASPLTAPYADAAGPDARPLSSVMAGIGDNPPAPPPVAPQAPQSLVDPASLPPRTDGIELNPDALRDLYQLDPEMAIKLQSSTFNANKEQFAEKQRVGSVVGAVSFRLKQLPPEQRREALMAMAPQLQGILPDQFLSPQALGQYPLDDASLDNSIAIGQSLQDLIRNKRDDEKPIPVRTEDPETGEITLSFIPRNGGGGSSGEPSADAVNFLRQNPALAPQFDVKYGQGASMRYLGGEQPMSEGEAAPILSSAQSTGTISRANVGRIRSAFGANGGAAFNAWLQKHKIKIVG